jgi:hypothetical protein
MPWDEELQRLSREVKQTFGDELYEDALTRALNAMEKARPDDVEGPFDGEVLYAALKLELRRRLQPH